MTRYGQPPFRNRRRPLFTCQHNAGAIGSQRKRRSARLRRSPAPNELAPGGTTRRDAESATSSFRQEFASKQMLHSSGMPFAKACLRSSLLLTAVEPCIQLNGAST